MATPAAVSPFIPAAATTVLRKASAVLANIGSSINEIQTTWSLTGMLEQTVYLIRIGAARPLSAVRPMGRAKIAEDLVAAGAETVELRPVCEM